MNLNGSFVVFSKLSPQEGCMKRDNVDRSGKRKVFVLRLRAQTIDSVKGGGATNQFGMRVFWFILSAACVAFGWVLLTILLR
jgi:hypothetical protein